MTYAFRARLVWSVARLAARLFFRMERVGPPVPDGPLVLVANHPNGLLDPAIVATTLGRVPRFLAKSTLFHGAPYSALIRAAGAIPVHRRHDAGADPAKNAGMFEAVGRALADGDAVCLFPEGISHSTGRLEPLKTGAARIVLASEAAGVPVTIAAVGLNFSTKGIFRSSVVVACGPAFDGRDLVDADNPLQPSSVDALTERIAQHIRDVMIEADPVADATLVARVERVYAAGRALPDDRAARLMRERAIARGLVAMRERAPDRVEQFRDALDRHERRLRRFGLDATSLTQTTGWRNAIRFAVREAVLAVVLLPVALLASLVFAVPYVAVDLLTRVVRFDPAVLATAKVMGGAVVHGSWVVAMAASAGWLVSPWLAPAVAVALPLLAVSGILAIERELAVIDAVRTWLALRRTSPQARMRLLQRQGELAALLDDAHAWVTRETA